MIAGLGLLLYGFIEEDEEKARKEHSLEWICGPDGGSKTTQRCSSDGPDNYTWSNGAENTGITISLAGVGLLVASASVAIGAGRTPAAPPAATAATPGYGGQPPYPPNNQGY
ncbi:hypothetical protein ACFYZN_32005 [Streptomyces sp. NPDC001777]|uniref:hypothetical protein n=1 Tax=Streptomyces sp. NPDC001777 TaxID=3364608 RepID=UPI0036BEB32D